MKQYLCSHLVKLRWAGGETGANLERISPEIASVNAEEPIEAGSRLVIDTQNCELTGTVQTCTAEPAGIFIEIQLDSEWSLDLFRPNHLTDPALVAATAPSATPKS